MRVILLLIELLVGTITSMSIAILAEKVVKRENVSVIDVLKIALSKWGGAFVTILLAGVIILAATLLLIIPGIIFSVNYVFVLLVIALRDKHGTSALAYSHDLVKGQWWRVFWYTLGMGLILWVLDLAIIYPLSKLTVNSYLLIAINFIPAIINNVYIVMLVVFFLNNELVHRRRRATVTEMETPPNIVKSPTGKRYPTVAEYLEISRKKKSALPKRSSSRGNAAKTAKKTAVKKKRTRNT
jgi:hypothetical protein